MEKQSVAGPGEGAPVIREAVALPEPKDFTPEELEELRAAAKRLVNKDGSVNTACVMLLIAKQLFNVAMLSLQQRVEALGESPDLAQVLGDAMKSGGNREFTRNDLLERIQRLAVPWLAAEIQETSKREAKVVSDDLAAEDRTRRRLPIPLGFKPGQRWPRVAGHPAMLNREKNLVLAGHPAAIGVALAALRAATPNLNRLWLVDSTRPHRDVTKRKRRHFEVGINRWLGFAASAKKPEQDLSPWLRFLTKDRVDLLVIEDLAQASGMPSSLSLQARAGEIHRRVRKWADAHGCGVVAGLPLCSNGQDPVCALDGIKLDHTWTQLEIYTDLVFLRVEACEGNNYQVHAGQHLDFTFDVPVGKPVPAGEFFARKTHDEAESEDDSDNRE